jgi:hypothetical protein
MQTIACPNCQQPLQIAPELAGQELACPRCQSHFVIPGGGPVSPPLNVGSAAGAAPAPGFQIQESRRPLHNQSASLLDLFDFSFTRYVTPLIVKITWVLALTLSVVWLLIVIAGLIITALPEIEVSEARKSEAPQQGRFEYEIKAPPIIERTGEAGYAVALRIVIAGTQLVTIVLFLLWLRVALEAVIVIFHMAANVKSIDEKTRKA